MACGLFFAKDVLLLDFFFCCPDSLTSLFPHRYDPASEQIWWRSFLPKGDFLCPFLERVEPALSPLQADCTPPPNLESSPAAPPQTPNPPFFQ